MQIAYPRYRKLTWVNISKYGIYKHIALSCNKMSRTFQTDKLITLCSRFVGEIGTYFPLKPITHFAQIFSPNPKTKKMKEAMNKPKLQSIFVSIAKRNPQTIKAKKSNILKVKCHTEYIFLTRNKCSSILKCNADCIIGPLIQWKISPTWIGRVLFRSQTRLV